MRRLATALAVTLLPLTALAAPTDPYAALRKAASAAQPAIEAQATGGKDLARNAALLGAVWTAFARSHAAAPDTSGFTRASETTVRPRSTAGSRASARR